MAERKKPVQPTVTQEELDKVMEERSPEEVTEDDADGVIQEIVDFEGRRLVALPNGENIFIRNPNQQEAEMAEQTYAMSLFRYHDEGLPYIAQICRSVLKMVENPDDFGYRERVIINQKEIEDTVEANRVILLAWEEERKTNPEAPEPKQLEAPEPDPDEGSESLKSLLADTDISPFEKTSQLLQCLARTEFANLAINCAEYRAGKARNRRILQSITEVGDGSVETGFKFKRKWKTKEEFDAEDPALIGFLEVAYTSYINEVNSQDFLLRLLNALQGGEHKSSSEAG